MGADLEKIALCVNLAPLLLELWTVVQRKEDLKTCSLSSDDIVTDLRAANDRQSEILAALAAFEVEHG
jgi:hypothetical protein